MKRSFIREILEATNSNTISFAGGLPNHDLFPIQELSHSATKVLSHKDTWQYSTSNGLPSLRRAIAKLYCDDGFESSEENILITTGSQQALYILARYYQDSSILIEAPSYLGAINSFRLNNLTMHSVPLTHNGIELELFQDTLHKTKLSYLIPDYQNPSTTTYSETKRQTIAKSIQQNDAVLIEDSPYSDIYFEQKHRSISSYIPDNSFHLGSFSKSLAPSLRIGWIRANKKLLDKLLPIKESIDLHSCGLSQAILSEYLQDTHKFQTHLQKLQNDYRERMETFCDILDTKLPQLQYTRPKGGMFVYGHLEGVGIYGLLEKCMRENVVFVPADEFFIDGRESGAMRLNFTNASPQEMTKGIEVIRRVIES